MNNLLNRNGFSLELVFLVIIAVCIALTILEWMWPKSGNIELSDEATLPIEEDISVPPLAMLDTRQQYAQISEKPLFTLDRQPYSVPEVEAPEPPRPRISEEEAVPAEPNVVFSLQGVIRTPNAQIALLKADNANNAQRVEISDKIAGWEVIAIENNLVTLEKEGQQQLVYLSPTTEASE